MARVLLVGYDPEGVDYSNPAYPPGMNAEKISAGIALTLKQMTDRGWESDVCYIRPDKAAGQTVERHLASANYDCVVIGAGVRLPPQGLEDSRLSSTPSIGALRARPLPSIRGPKTAPTLPRDGYLPADHGQVGEAAGTWSQDGLLLQRVSPLLAQSGHHATEFQCPLSGVKRTLSGHLPTSAFDPKRT
jgi:hypothetical protein